MTLRLKLPYPLGKYRGRNYFRFTVRLEQSGLGWVNHHEVEIIASSATDAVQAIQSEFAWMMQRPTEFETRGPRGGVIHRFMGWESLVGAKLLHTRRGQAEFTF